MVRRIRKIFARGPRKGTVVVALLALAISVAPTWHVTLQAAIAATLLTADKSTVDGTGFTTASITPSANALVIGCVAVASPTDSIASPTLSGNSLTYVEESTQNFTSGTGTNRRRVTLFRAMGASPTSGAVTITYGTSVNSVVWSVFELTGTDTSGSNGSGAIVAEAGGKDETGSATVLTLSMATFSHANNGAASCFQANIGTTGTPDTGWTELSDTNVTANDITLETQWRADNDTGPNAVGTFASAANMGGVAIEVKAGTATTSRMTLLGVGGQ